MEAWLRRQTTPVGLAKRARAMLLLADGHHVSETATLVDMQRRHLYQWIERFRDQGIPGLREGKRPGRPPVFSPRGRDAYRQTGVHCSWMNQVEQWFSILQRKRLAIADFADKAELAERLHAFVKEWNEHAHPFQWTKKSVTKIMAKCKTQTALAA